MKKRSLLKMIFSLLLCLSMTTIMFNSCSDCDVPEILTEVTDIAINPSGEISVEIGKTTTLTATVMPDNATNKDIIWSSLRNNIATVDAQTGVVTGVSTGTATIRATAADGSGITANKIVTVTIPEPEMIFVKGGTFTMGCTSEQGYDCDNNERPTHQVTLSDYYIGKYQVTQEQWIAIMGSNPSYFKGDNFPVEQVSWHDIIGHLGKYEVINGIRYYENGFIYKLNAATGKKYRLPTESEWEYAARGGNQSKGFKYSGSNNANDVAWYFTQNGTRPVGTKQANELGIYDMSGNVSEWCSDWHGNYTDTSKNNPTGPSNGLHPVARGGSWLYGERLSRVSARFQHNQFSRIYDFGFRLALVP